MTQRQPSGSMWARGGSTGASPSRANEPIRSSGFRKASGQVGRTLSAMEMLESPSRGLVDEDESTSLRNPRIQEQFRQHIADKSNKLRVTFQGIDVVKNEEDKTKWRSELSIILLDYRKLREGIKSIRRVDEFTIEVYESSVRCSLEAHNLQQLSACLPNLIVELYPILLSPTTLDSALEALHIDDTAPVARPLPLGPSLADRFVYFSSLYLLYNICTLHDLPSFHPTLASLNSNGHLPPSSPTVALVTKVYSALLNKNYSAFGRLLDVDDGDAIDRRQRILIATATERMREQAWISIGRSYKQFTDLEWLGRMLLFDSDAERDAKVKAFLVMKAS